ARGQDRDADGWRMVRLLDPDEVPYREGSADAGEVIATNARLLAGTPHWLGPGTVPRTDQYLIDHVDATDIEALTDPAVPDRMTGPGFTQSVAGRKWRHLVSLDDASAARVPACPALKARERAQKAEPWCTLEAGGTGGPAKGRTISMSPTRGTCGRARPQVDDRVRTAS